MNKMLPVLILAGGLATRLRPITESIPKSLVQVAGEPFICRQLRYLKSQGILTVVICIGYLGEMIEKVVGDGSKFGLKVLYSSDGPNLLGTGGAIKQAFIKNPDLLGDAFFVLYGDSFLPIEYLPVQKVFEEARVSNKTALMTVLKNQNQWDKSNVLFDGKVLIEYNKVNPKPEMSYIDYGLSILCSSVLGKYIVGEAFDLAAIYHELSILGQLKGYEVFERFYEMGSHTGLKETEEYFLKRY
jgi:N-acetyl-alpha-D-muramate 1-phosphate uridylyltransferase